MKRKLLMLLSYLACVLLISAACAGNGSKGTAVTDIGISGANQFPITGERITMSIFTEKNPYIENFETNEFTQWYEDKTNIHIDWQVATGDLRQALNLKIASGDYPDMMFCIGLTKSEQLVYAKQGVFIDIGDYIDQYGYHLNSLFNERSDIKQDISIYGSIYGLPRIIENYKTEYKNMMWVYKPWLDRLGIDMPETTEEFYQMLKAFKEKDPNGNGIMDEVPLAARGLANNMGIESFIMSAFIPVSEDRFYIEDGKVKFAAAQPEYREGLRYLRTLYKEGLLYADTFIIDRAQIMALGENEPEILGAGAGMFPGMFSIQGAPSGRFINYVGVPPLKGPGGVRATVKSVDTYVSMFNVTTACKYPEAAVKWVDWFFSEEGRLLSQGNTTTRTALEGEMGVDGEQALWTVEPKPEAETAAGMAQNKSWMQYGIYYFPYEVSVKTCYLNGSPEDNGTWYKAYKDYSAYGINNYCPDMPIAEENVEEYTEYLVTFRDEVNKAFAGFVIGDLSIENDWDRYVANLNALGLNRYIEILQETYDKGGY